MDEDLERLKKFFSECRNLDNEITCTIQKLDPNVVVSVMTALFIKSWWALGVTEEHFKGVLEEAMEHFKKLKKEKEERNE